MDIGNIVYTCDNTEMTERDKGIERERERDKDRRIERERNREKGIERNYSLYPFLSLFLSICLYCL